MLLGTAFTPARPEAAPSPAIESLPLAQLSAEPQQATTLPDWLQVAPGRSGPAVPASVVTSREAGLWSGTDDRAISFGTIPVGVTLRPLGPIDRGRLFVYYAGDGASRAAGPAWVDAQVLEPVPVASAAPPSTAAAPALRSVTAQAPRRIKDTP
ncbi:MAG TPA: hypothetical protein VM347_09055, partial [Nonomuraea sp.]|nr:hypothetical protein [Nonomuraea sp.]